MKGWTYVLCCSIVLIFSPAFSQVTIKNRSLAIAESAPREAQIVVKQIAKRGDIICYALSENPLKKYCAWVDHRYTYKKTIVLFIALEDSTNSKLYHFVKIYWEGDGIAHRWDSYREPEFVENMSSPDGPCSLVDERNLASIFCKSKNRNIPIPFENAEKDLRLDEARLERDGLFYLPARSNEKGCTLSTLMTCRTI